MVPLPCVMIELSIVLLVRRNGTECHVATVKNYVANTPLRLTVHIHLPALS